jgi:hypothetical protein
VKLLREPLLHFLLLGAGLFVAFGLAHRRTGPRPGNIVVTQGQIEQLAAGFTRFHRRPPSPDELEGLIRDHVREEVYYREALALGLDRDDANIRRRLRQKMEFISDDVAAMAEPTDEQLRAHLAAHPDAFRIEPRFTFEVVYLDPQRRSESLARDAAHLLARLNQAGARADGSTVGDPFLLDHEFEEVASSEVATLFGERFAAKLGELAPRRWEGPIESGYGAHLVCVRERTEGRVPALDEVRDAVRREWANVQRQKASEQFYAGLLARYAVTIEQPAPTDGGRTLAAAAPR